MSGKTSIEWTDLSWNPTTGCTRVTAGCDHCYAFTLHDMRHEAHLKGKSVPGQYSKPFSEIQLLPERLEDPLRWKKPKRIFVNSMSDLFHSKIPDEYIVRVFDTMKRAHWHTFQILTKRGNRLAKLAPELEWAPNIHMGVSIEHDLLTPRANQVRFCGAAVTFLSCEPLLGPLPSLDLTGIDWVIVGGESGEGARPLHPDWVRDIRDRCVERDIPFFFKQHGGRTPKAGGRLLDGRTWDQFPGSL